MTKNIAYTGSNTASQSTPSNNAWFTPPEYIQKVREVLGSIELDPFSCEKANETVGANTIFTEGNSALDKEWVANTVFCNPPYSGGLVAPATAKYVQQWQDRNFKAGIVLVNNCTDTAWFDLLWKNAQAVCFTRGRISFESYDGKKISGNTRGQTLFYFGDDVIRFREIFGEVGNTAAIAPVKTTLH